METKETNKSIKLRIYHSITVPKLTYARKTWKIKIKQESIINEKIYEKVGNKNGQKNK